MLFKKIFVTYLFLGLCSFLPLFASIMSEDENYDWIEEQAYFRSLQNVATVLAPQPCSDVYLLGETISYTITGGATDQRSKDNYSYNSNGLLTYRINYNWNGTAWVNDQQYSYTYNADNNLSTRIRQDWDGFDWVNKYKYDNTFDIDNNRIESTRSDWNTVSNQWELSRRYTYYYDGNNNLIQRLLEFRSGVLWVRNTRYDYTVAANGLRIDNTIYKWVGNSWIPDGFYDYTYNADGCLTVRNYQGVGSPDSKWEYSYNANGYEIQWIKSIRSGLSWIEDSAETSSWFLFYQTPVVAITAVNPLCQNDSAFTLSASHPGGVWGGAASSSGQINPSSLGAGTFSVSYDFTDVYGCTYSDQINITITSSDQTNLTATTCDPDLVGIDTLILQNQIGCDSVIITEYIPMELIEAHDDEFFIQATEVLEVDLLENDIYNNASSSIIGGAIDGLSVVNGFLSFSSQNNIDQQIVFEYLLCDDFCPENCDTALVSINLTGEDLLIPNAISPNGDGKNEFWVIPRISQYPNHKLIIINRWSQVLFEASPYNNDWAGTTNDGSPLPEGTYYYSITLMDGKTPIQNGTITIIR